MDSFHAYWLGVAIGSGAGIILGWTFHWARVRIKRTALQRARRDAEDVHRILSFKKVPERTMEKIAQDQPAKPQGPQHLRVEDPWWAEFRDNPRKWVRIHLPQPQTPEGVAEQTYQEFVCATKQPGPSPTATPTGSFSGPTGKPPAPWLGSIMTIARASTTAPYQNSVTSFILATSLLK